MGMPQSSNQWIPPQVTPGLIVVATPRELQEMDISLLLELPAWLEDECELDILNLTKEIPDPSVPPFLVIQSAGDKSKDTQPGSPQPGIASQSGRGASVVSSLYYLCKKIWCGII